MADDLRPDSEFLRFRRQELQNEQQELEATIGEPITESSVSRYLGYVLEGLRKSGNDSLAWRYQSALEQFHSARGCVKRVHDAGEVDEAASEAMNDALEESERVEAEARAWFDAFEEKGGA